MRIRVTKNEVPRHMRRAEDAVEDFPENLTENLEDHLSENAPVDSGNLADSFFHTKSPEPGTYIVSSTEDHAEWADSGTGVYEPGGSGEPLQPTEAKALKFYWDKAGGMTIWKGDLAGPREKEQFVRWANYHGMIPFTVWPRGMPGHDYVDPSIEEAENDAEFVLDETLTDHRAWE